MDNIIAELKHKDRICQITLHFHSTSQIEDLWTAMQVPFPELVLLYLSCGGLSYVPVLPDLFSGGSTPRLRYLALNSIPFPGLPKLLLSATHLVNLSLCNIPHSGYISPESMATCLSMLTSLESLNFQFESPQSSPHQENRRSPPPTRSILPALMMFSFKGANEYLEELLARIDTPQLCRLSAIFFNDIDFDTPELIRWAQICTTSLPLLSTTENLFISQLDWKDGIENIGWLELLLPFTAVKNFYLSKQSAPRIALALQEITGGGTAVLSTLQNLYLEGFQSSKSVQEGIKRFVSARRLTNRPVTISVWERDRKAEDLLVDL